MHCRLTDLRKKEVINVKDGARLGTVCDAELDADSARLTAIVIYGRLRFLGLMGRDDDIVIRWPDIRIIGDDTILVNYQEQYRPGENGGFFLYFSGMDETA